MYKSNDEMVDKEQSEKEPALIDLGEVSTETRGLSVGHSWDGGFGVRFP